ncbi:hypothetical protein HDF18_08410 [Mucilaginibacter sp. X5P1]|uniref:hypothetical protein n=1 Tax=Mucilaginibacter sp. X5P1 TaxID=2723088 RepID=UPI001613F87E|nr:hypothetical protein [Mucilaginibacter sp. X5P1]MBB6137679.1 choline kinase [Mucilaginibacter sp. X5P1]
MVEITNLKSSFKKLGMGAQFIQQAERLGVHTLGDIMKANLPALKQNKEFTYSWYIDVLNLLKKHNLLRKFQERQWS